MVTKRTILIPIYKVWLKIVVTDDIKEWIENPGDHVNAKMYEYEDLGCAEIVISKDTSPGDIAHECGHVKNMIFRRMRHIPDLENDEPEQYLLGYLVDEVYKVIVKHKK